MRATRSQTPTARLSAALLLVLTGLAPHAHGEEPTEPATRGLADEALQVAWALTTDLGSREPPPAEDTVEVRARFEAAQGAMRRAQARGDDEAMRAALVMLAILSEQRGRHALGLAYASRARLMTPEGSDPRLEAALLGVLGVLQMRVGQLGAAADILEQALALRREVGDRAGEAATLANLAQVRLRRGDAEAAVRSYRAAESIQQDPALAADRLGTLIGLAMAVCRLGDVAEAMACLERAEHLAVVAERPLDRARVLAARGSMLRRLTRYAASIADLQRAEALFRAAGDRIGHARVLLDLAQSEAEVGRFASSLAYLGQAREVCRAGGDRVAEACALRRSAQVLVHSGRTQEAVARLREARRVYALIEDPVGGLWTDTEIANLLLRTGGASAARDLHASVLETAVRIGHEEAVTTAEANLGLAELALGRHAAARARLQHAIVQAHRLGLPRVETLATWALALVHHASGDPANTVLATRRAVEALDAGFTGMDGLSTALGTEVWAALFGLGIHAAVELEDAEAALLFMEYGRARSLLRSIGGRRAVMAAAVPEPLVEAEAVARSHVVRAHQATIRARRTGAIQDVREARTGLERARKELAEAHVRIERHTCIGSLVGAAPPTLVRVQARLDPDQALVLYASALGRAVALRVTTDAVRLLDLGDEEALRLATHALLDEQGDARAAAARGYLREHLLDALALPSHVTRLVLSPQGALGQVPFALLAAEREIVLTPSASLWHRATEEEAAPGEGVLAVGGPRRTDGRPLVDPRGGALPDLVGARAEARAVGSVILVDEAATPAGFQRAIGFHDRWRAVHFACHAVIDSEDPMQSALILAPDDETTGHLCALDVLRLRVPTDLAVLSGCSTGRGRIFRVDGIMGLASAFQHAGARRVLCSLWDVDDEATAALMHKFHELWSAMDAGPRRLRAARALRQAQEHVRAQPRWAHPRYWAAWVLWDCGR